MRRLGSLVSVVVLWSLVTFGLQPPAYAQEATPDTSAMLAMATHPAVGGWQFTNDTGEGFTFPSLGLVHADGTYTEVLPDGGVLTGVWRPTGARTADLTLFSNHLVDDKLVHAEGRFTLDVDATGNTISEVGIFVSRFEDGTIEFAGEVHSPGTRLEVAPMVSLEELVGTPVAATPTP
jgi:hypothetical protein